MARRLDILAEIDQTLSGSGPAYEYASPWIDSSDVLELVISCTVDGDDVELLVDESNDQTAVVLTTEVGPVPRPAVTMVACRYFRLRATSTTPSAAIRASVRMVS